LENWLSPWEIGYPFEKLADPLIQGKILGGIHGLQYNHPFFGLYTV
jgi:hypothetical protein